MPRMNRMLSILLCLLPAFPLLGQAPVAESHLAAAMELIEITSSRAAFMRYLNEAMQETYQQLRANGYSEEKISEARRAVNEIGAKIYKDQRLRSRLADYFTSNYNESEIRDLVAFFRTPTGRKFNDKFDELHTSLNEIGGEVTQDYMAELQMTLAQILQSQR